MSLEGGLFNGLYAPKIANVPPAKLITPTLAETPAQAGQKFDTVFSTFTIDLTTAHTDLAITTQRPLDWIQAWCDGSLAGISIKIGDQSKPSINLSQINTIPIVSNSERIYLTNDVRPGRSVVVIYWVRGQNPLNLAMGGDPVSMAELAARLGAISLFDRRGEIMFQDSFEDGVGAWEFTRTPATVTTNAISTAFSKSGQASLAFAPGATIGNLVQANHYLHYAALARHGIELSLMHMQGNVLTFGLTAMTGLSAYTAFIRLTGNGVDLTVTIEYYNAAAGWTLLTPTPILTQSSTYLVFNVLKLVVDFRTLKYSHLIINNNVYDLSQYAINTVAGANTPMLWASIKCSSRLNTSYTDYVDDVLVTQNEP